MTIRDLPEVLLILVTEGEHKGFWLKDPFPPRPSEPRALQRWKTTAEIVLGVIVTRLRYLNPILADDPIPFMSVADIPVADEKLWGQLSLLTLAGHARLIRV